MTVADPFGLVGQVLDGQFRVERSVGEGGFSTVYRGTSLGLNEPIAIKCLKLPGALGSALVESFVQRFRDESRICYKLSQGNLHVVRSLGSGTTIAPSTSALVPYTILEWLEGCSLAQELEDRRARGMRGRPLPEVVALLDSAVDAVAYAHAQGVVHRDLNPGNLFLARTPAGTKLKVLDFGVAKILGDSSLATGQQARTVGNVRLFAPAYGAPEQFDDRVGPVGPWTDVYALALVVLEALSDRTVMEGDHIGELLVRALDPGARPTPRALGILVSAAVEQVLTDAVALSPAQRPRDAGELWGRLKHAMLAARPAGPARAGTAERSQTMKLSDGPARPASVPPPSSDDRPPDTLRMGQAPPAEARAPRVAPTLRMSAPPSAQPAIAPPPFTPPPAPVTPPVSSPAPVAPVTRSNPPAAPPPPIFYRSVPPPASPVVPSQPPPRSRSWIVVLVVAVLLVAGGLGYAGARLLGP